MNKLEQEVDAIMQEHGSDYESGVGGFMEDLSQGGCASGLVGSLIYYSDTIPFFERNKEDINELLVDCMEQMGAHSPADIFPMWDKTDPLAMDTQNQNLLAWFAFEETANRLYFGQ